MTFDEKLRLRARTEDCPLPQGFQERLEEKIDEITEKAESRGKSGYSERSFWRRLSAPP